MGQKRTLCGRGYAKVSLTGTIGPRGKRSCAEGGCEIVSRHYGREQMISQST